MVKSRTKQGGFAYLGVLFFVAIMGIVSATAGAIWSIAQQREKEKELLFVGDQFRKAIGRYYENSPGTLKRYPNSLEDLLLDKRFVTTQRYLRRIYVDPMTLKSEWGLIKAPEGGIMGVHSMSNKHPMKIDNFRDADRF